MPVSNGQRRGIHVLPEPRTSGIAATEMAPPPMRSCRNWIANGCAAALGGTVTPANEFCCDGGTAIVAFARRAGIAAHVLPKPSKPTRQAPDYHLNNVNAYHGRLKEWLRRFHGVATKKLSNYLRWRRTLEARGGNATSAKMILGAIGMGPYQQMTP
jgi:hypothetical protein